MARKRNDIVLAPLEDGNQRLAIRSNADIVCFTGGTGGGKSVALYYAPIEHLAMNDNAKIVCFMRNVSDFWGAGKVNDTLKKMYPLIDRSVKKQPHDPIGEIIRNQTDMGMKLYNGSEIKFQQLDNENPIVIDKITKGLQAKKLTFGAQYPLFFHVCVVIQAARHKYIWHKTPSANVLCVKCVEKASTVAVGLTMTVLLISQWTVLLCSFVCRMATLTNVFGVGRNARCTKSAKTI